jgi:NAD(P)-dependent dehydrogenase (short-subunit alcohol dehydrogenase family)
MGVLTDRVAIVTDAAKGIGRAIAMTLVHQGALVISADIDVHAGEQALAEFRTINPRSVFQRVDIADSAEVAAFVARCAQLRPDRHPREQRGGHAADRFLRPRARGYGPDYWRQRQRHPRDDAGKGYRNTSNIGYAASKGAVLAMTRIAAVQLGKYGITVNAVYPGITETELMTAWLDAKAAESGKPKQELMEELLAGSALERMNTPLDVADAVFFLVSEAARNITGQSLNVDGGTMCD